MESNTMAEAEAKENLIVTLKARAEEFDFSKLRAAENNKGASSGAAMHEDFHRMDFIINEKKIDRNLTIALKEGTRDYKSELFIKDDIYNLENGKKREIDTDQGRAFVDSVFKDFEKELAQDALHELWDDHYKNPETADHQKTDAYKKGFERFYNAGQKYKHLLPKREDESKNYRLFAKEIFKEMFEYAKARVPSDPILEELVTNCNQAAYLGALYGEDKPLLHVAKVHELSFRSSSTTHINCSDSNHATVSIEGKISTRAFANPNEELCQLNSSLEFTLESQDGKDGVTYKDGKLLLTVSQELENYHTTNKEEQLQSDDTVKKSLLDIIIESFLILIEKFVGTKLKNKQGIHNEIKNTLSRSNSSEAIVIKDTGHSPIKIECSLGDPLKVNSYLENVEPPVHCDDHVHGSLGLLQAQDTRIQGFLN
ncbi:MAG: hypothetical protein LBC34_03340 [Rickettsiales bacterium]|jgi:hypothetical protein|nr:hypothetical protein [Rickettsiales bacterium]